MLKQYKLRFYNFRLIIFLLAISLIGVTLVGTAASDLRSKQFAGVILGLIVMLVLSLLDYSWIMNFQWIMYGFNIVMLLAVRLCVLLVTAPTVLPDGSVSDLSDFSRQNYQRLS